MMGAVEPTSTPITIMAAGRHEVSLIVSASTFAILI
jgi:hypothetical protein